MSSAILEARCSDPRQHRGDVSDQGDYSCVGTPITTTRLKNLCSDPKTPFNDDYEIFFKQLGDVLVNAITSLTLPEEQRRVLLAAQEASTRHSQMLRELADVSRVAEKSEAKFTRMAQEAPVGLVVFQPDSTPVFLNDTYRKLVGITDELYESLRDAHNLNAWQELIHEEDRMLVKQKWEEVTRDKQPVTFEHRFKRKHPGNEHVPDDVEEF